MRRNPWPESWDPKLRGQVGFLTGESSFDVLFVGQLCVCMCGDKFYSQPLCATSFSMQVGMVLFSFLKLHILLMILTITKTVIGKKINIALYH